MYPISYPREPQTAAAAPDHSAAGQAAGARRRLYSRIFFKAPQEMRSLKFSTNLMTNRAGFIAEASGRNGDET